MTEPKTEHDSVAPAGSSTDAPPTPKLDEIGQAFRDQHLAALKNFFTYHPPTAEQQKQYVAIRNAALKFALELEDNVPNGDDKKRAIELLRSSVMTANQGIACGGLDYRL